MKIYKFGGASISTAKAIENLFQIVTDIDEGLVIVVSAMGKTTNLIEAILAHSSGNPEKTRLIDSLKSNHLKIVNDLGIDQQRFLKLFESFEKQLSKKFASVSKRYDQIVCYGELFSSNIIHQYLESQDKQIHLVAAKEMIRTDARYQDAQVDWNKTHIQTKSLIQYHQLYITQGFIAGGPNGEFTTLGREGSDFTGAILAHCLDATSLTVWKDVPGILSADPKITKTAIKFDNISYEEAAELTYYGAKVIHPKTIRPLANKGIPLYVKPFAKPDDKGTVIDENKVEKWQPSIIYKEQQTLISFVVEDFQFINEANLSEILHTLTLLGIRINLMQNSAISFSICIDQNKNKTQELLSLLTPKFSIKYNEDLKLITVKNSSEASIEQVSRGQDILLEQKTRHNYQIVVKPKFDRAH